MWQEKDLRKRIFGCVAIIGLAGDFSEVWQIREIATFWREVGVGYGGVRRTARRRMSRQPFEAPFGAQGKQGKQAGSESP